jgi:hypothetical protein
MKHAIAASSALLVIAVSLLAFGVQSSIAVRGVQPCVARVSLGVIPAWARDGFSGSQPRMPHVVGRGGRIAALVFGYPLLSPPASNRANKILWVERRSATSPTALWIHAQRMAGVLDVGSPTTRVVKGGPGPSIIDLPAAGCWRLTLHWAGRTDSLDVQYRTQQ